MNLTDYLKHKEHCELQKPFNEQRCDKCNMHIGLHYDPYGIIHCPIPTPGKHYDPSTVAHVSCTCPLSSITDRLVLLPEDIQETLENIIGGISEPSSYQVKSTAELIISILKSTLKH